MAEPLSLERCGPVVIIASARTADAIEGMMAFVKKRKPIFNKE